MREKLQAWIIMHFIKLINYLFVVSLNTNPTLSLPLFTLHCFAWFISVKQLLTPGRTYTAIQCSSFKNKVLHTPLRMLIKPTVASGCKMSARRVRRVNPAKFGLSVCSSLHFLRLFSISQKKQTTNVNLAFHRIHDYFHSTMEVHSLTIIRRKWQRKPPSSDKHMNTWIYE